MDVTRYRLTQCPRKGGRGEKKNTGRDIDRRKRERENGSSLSLFFPPHQKQKKRKEGKRERRPFSCERTEYHERLPPSFFMLREREKREEGTLRYLCFREGGKVAVEGGRT